MSKHILKDLYKEAVLSATASVADLAREAGYSPATVNMYVYSERGVSPRAATEMAKALKAKAERMSEAAKLLKKAADDAPRTRRRTRRAKG